MEKKLLELKLKMFSIFLFSIFLAFITTFRFHVYPNDFVRASGILYFFISLFLYIFIFKKLQDKYIKFIKKIIFKNVKSYDDINQNAFTIFSRVVGLSSVILLLLIKYYQYLAFKPGGDYHYRFLVETVTCKSVPILILMGFLILAFMETYLLIKNNKFSFFKSLILSINSKIIFYFMWFVVVLFTWVLCSFINGLINLFGGAPFVTG